MLYILYIVQYAVCVTVFIENRHKKGVCLFVVQAQIMPCYVCSQQTQITPDFILIASKYFAWFE